MTNGESSYRRFLSGDDTGMVELVRDYKDGLLLYLNSYTSITRPPLHWDEMAVDQQYNMAEFGSPLSFYKTAEKEVSADKIWDYINIAYMSGYDYYTDTYYHCYAGAYLINGYTDKELIAIKFEESDEYFVYYYGLSVDDINQEALDEILADF